MKRGGGGGAGPLSHFRSIDLIQILIPTVEHDQIKYLLVCCNSRTFARGPTCSRSDQSDGCRFSNAISKQNRSPRQYEEQSGRSVEHESDCRQTTEQYDGYGRHATHPK